MTSMSINTLSQAVYLGAVHGISVLNVGLKLVVSSRGT